MKFYCIADADTVRGFRLAGVPGEAVDSDPEAADALARAARRPDLGIVILTDQVAAGIRDEVDALRMGRGRPLVVEIPGPEGRMHGRKTLREFVQEAVGIRIGQQEEP
ncbi:MAG: V-type ATP synthase subunit F [Planctomycetota bacterium]|nr:V-type ATP synthase subunit F [Planctomycetota bacterium]